MKREMKDYYLELLEIGEILKNNDLYFRVEPPISDSELKDIENVIGKELPSDYVEWLRLTKEIWLMDSFPDSGYLGLNKLDIYDDGKIRIGDVEGETDNYYLDIDSKKYYREIGFHDPQVIEFASFEDMLIDFLQLVDDRMTEEYGNRWKDGIMDII